jgi:hypothetical protein
MPDVWVISKIYTGFILGEVQIRNLRFEIFRVPLGRLDQKDCLPLLSGLKAFHTEGTESTEDTEKKAICFDFALPLCLCG